MQLPRCACDDENSVCGYPDVILYMDKKAHLLLKWETTTIDLAVSGKEVTSESYLGDYKKIGKSRVPHSFRVVRDGKQFLEGTVTKYQTLESLDASTFTKP
ncbi:MAG: hypothetical protein CMJ64_18465 [Planctomycetaceae bacterium]|nr:hypothetical protein [Planctomycetaceae bacterium]